MATIRVSIRLPHLLLIPSGEYPTPALGGSVHLAVDTLSKLEGTPQTRASSLFEARNADDADSTERQRTGEADRLLRRVNFLLRWHRVVTKQMALTEVTRAQASPFYFSIEGTSEAWGSDEPLKFESFFPSPPTGSQATHGEEVRKGLATSADPDVARLNLLDAEYALSIGRFREAVLLCWAAIDSTFNSKFKAIVDDRVGDEWADGLKFLKGMDFGLRHKMTIGMRLLTGRSLFKVEPEGSWEEISTSYGQRNKIIHEGQVAHEDDAKLAIKAARTVLRFVEDLNKERTEPSPEAGG